MGKIKAIETEYGGYKFRSRLEARWAVFFDAMGIKYKYELEGFEMESGERYLPDFYLPEPDVYVEVKPHDPSRFRELKKVIHFVTEDPSKVVLVLTDIPNIIEPGVVWHPAIYYSAIDRTPVIRMAFFETGGVNCNTSQSRDSTRPVFYYWNGKKVITEDCLTKSGYIRDEHMPENKSIRISGMDIIEHPTETLEAMAMLARGKFDCVSNQDLLLSCSLRDAYKEARTARFEFGQTPGGDA